MKVPFKKGDMIGGFENNGYIKTNEDMLRGVVIDTDMYGDMEVKILEHVTPYLRNSTYWVENSSSRFYHYVKKFDPSSIQIFSDYKRTVKATCKGLTGEAICNLEVDSFDYNYGVGLALKRLGEKMIGENPSNKKPVQLAKIVRMMAIDDGCGLSVGDIVEVAELVCKNSGGAYLRCTRQTYFGDPEIENKYKYPVQFFSPEQYELI